MARHQRAPLVAAIVAVIFYALSRLIRCLTSAPARHTPRLSGPHPQLAVCFFGMIAIAARQHRRGLGRFWSVPSSTVCAQDHAFRYQATWRSSPLSPDLLRQSHRGEPGEFWGPRMYTVPARPDFLLCLRANCPRRRNTGRDRRLHFDAPRLSGHGHHRGTFRFQSPLEWVVTSWAAVVLRFLAPRCSGSPALLHQDCF